MKILTTILILLLFSIPSLAAEKIQKTPSTIFCGKYGGYPEPINDFKFDISTRALASAALSYSWWAPHPLGIKHCVCHYYPDFPSCERVKVLHAIHNMCGDTWCEGHYNYKFTNLDKSWTLYYTTIELYKEDGIHSLKQPLYHKGTCKINKFIYKGKIPTIVMDQITNCIDNFHKQLQQIKKAQ